MSTFSPSNPTIWIRIPLNSTGFFCKHGSLDGNKNLEKETGNGELKILKIRGRIKLKRSYPAASQKQICSSFKQKLFKHVAKKTTLMMITSLILVHFRFDTLLISGWTSDAWDTMFDQCWRKCVASFCRFDDDDDVTTNDAFVSFHVPEIRYCK